MSSHPVEKALQQVRFQVSAQKFSQCPEDTGYEIAFAGRSNAGKSSALNRLCSQKQLARTSKTPGRTQLINFFALDEQRRLVDLPGYGYAKVDKSTRLAWQKELDGYLAQRQCLRGLILLMDVRHPLSPFDTMILDWGHEANLPIHFLLTKSDKLNYGPGKNTLQKVQNQLRAYRNPISGQLFSSTNGQGTNEAWDLIGQWLELELPEENR